LPTTIDPDPAEVLGRYQARAARHNAARATARPGVR